MYICGRQIIGRRLVWGRGAGAFGYPRGSGSGSGNLNSDDARETGSHLDSSRRLRDASEWNAELGFTVPAALDGPRWSRQRTKTRGRGRRHRRPSREGDSIHLVPMYHSLPIRRFPGTCRPCSAAMGGFATMVAALGSSCRITGVPGASLLCRRRDAVPSRPGETGEGEGGCLCLWRELVPAPAWLLPS